MELRGITRDEVDALLSGTALMVGGDSANMMVASEIDGYTL